MPTKTETATPQLCSAFLGTGEPGAKGRLKRNAVIPAAEAELEKAIVQAGAAKAPRLTPADIDACIVSEHCFTAAEGCLGEWQYRYDMSEAPAGSMENIPGPLCRLTFCVLLLRNGFTVTGESACASPENFNAEVGVHIARENAREKIWMLEGYLLRERLAGQPKAQIHICGVTCHKGDENCNGYCIGRAPRAKPFDLEES